MKKLAISVLIVVSLIFSIALTNDINRAAFLFSSGNIVYGEALGISIGESRENAIARLEDSGLILREQTKTILCRPSKGDEGVTYDLLRDSSWRSGMVCLGSKEDRIVRIVWRFYPYDSIAF